MLGKKFDKSEYNEEEYYQCAMWANENNAVMEDKGDYIECVPIPAPTLDDTKETKIKKLKSARDAEELSPIEYRGWLFDFDDKAQQRINGAIIALADGGAVTWTSADNQEIPNVSAQDLRGVVGAAAIRSNAVHVKYRALKERVEACETNEQVELIVW